MSDPLMNLGEGLKEERSRALGGDSVTCYLAAG